MNKKIIFVISILILAWLTVFIVDYNRCSNMKEPVFVIVKQENDLTMKSITYQGLGYRVEVEKTVSAKCGPEITKVEMYLIPLAYCRWNNKLESKKQAICLVI